MARQLRWARPWTPDGMTRTVRAMPEMHAARRAAAQQRIVALGADAALITSGVNVRYLTGLVSSNAALLLSPDGQAVLGTDSRYAGTAERECRDTELVIERDVEPALVSRALANGWRTIAFEDQEMTVARHRLVTAAGDDDNGGGPALVPAGGAIDELRIVKDDTELELLARACSITGEAFSAVLGRMRPRVTSSRRPGTAGSSRTGWATASACRSTRRRSSGTAGPVH